MDLNTREWMYIDSYGEQKGPLPASLLLRLLDKGIGISGSTLVWKADMPAWLTMNAVCKRYPYLYVCIFSY